MIPELLSSFRMARRHLAVGVTVLPDTCIRARGAGERILQAISKLRASLSAILELDLSGPNMATGPVDDQPKCSLTLRPAEPMFRDRCSAASEDVEPAEPRSFAHVHLPKVVRRKSPHCGSQLSSSVQPSERMNDQTTCVSSIRLMER